jgi:hypothetical protein
MNLDHRAGLYGACRQLSPIHPDHATLPIQEGFNWSSCLAEVPFSRLYLVVFRSVRRTMADLELLKEHDAKAYAEALEAGGLLRYFRGSMNERRECLSFCLWESREQARRAAGGASHRRATEITAAMYESYALERYDLIKEGTRDLVFRRHEGISSRGDARGGAARVLQEARGDLSS